jgi:hypothetical protein
VSKRSVNRSQTVARRSCVSFPLPRLELYRHVTEGTGDWRIPIAAESIAHDARTALRNQLADFCAIVRGEAAPRVSGHEGFSTLAATLAIIRSGETEEVVRLPTPAINCG